ncbi:uncharacterized protein LOC103360689 isoform X2 [Stegastes partitus]|uniref:Uncharacterized protein LOC103360689 isoform X2 n=1 Tax=Stegastes partitus TaxID=144197 RepID=A0A9Y4K0I9_9TELE|nr:PREDICTED: uncharacterized protein LOC103360689 isoform X2 [Stegastes partitus]
MSADGTKLLFEGFLQKRKDTLSHLRGYYYIYTVQSVREVQKTDRHRFMFEIVMTNGKRKVLAAETAALRKEWVGHLWKAMNLSTSGLSSSGVALPQREQQPDRVDSITSVHCSDSVVELPPPGPQPSEDTSIQPPMDQPEEPSNGPQWCSVLDTAEDRQEGDYDVLPIRNKTCEPSLAPEMEDNVYDFPQSYRNSAQHQDSELTESIYDVPSSLLRDTPDDTTDEQLEKETNWKMESEDNSSTCSSQFI